LQPQPAARDLPPQLQAQIAAQGPSGQLQDLLMKQAAMMSKPSFTDYKVGPEDLLQISFLAAEKLSTEARVSGKGEIRLLLVGDVQVAGLSPDEISRKLAMLYQKGDYLRNPNITVSVKEFQHQRVAVTGAVKTPGYFPLIGPRSLLEVLGMAGGLTELAGETVHVMRPQGGGPIAVPIGQEPQAIPGAEATVVDLNRLLVKGEIQQNVTLQNGDVVFVPFAQTAYVMGAVNKPGGVPIKDNMTAIKAVSFAGGTHPVLASNSATVVRTDAAGRRTAIPIDLGQITSGRASDLPLVENDIVVVHESGIRRFLYDVKQFFPGSVGMTPF
ncbi:MAG: polysaccharide biosynthesis/export family protein, partial [Syntrophobacteraceae bacterium]